MSEAPDPAGPLARGSGHRAGVRGAALDEVAPDPQPGGELTRRVDALAEAVELARPHLPEQPIVAASIVVDKTRERLRHGTAFTVVAVAGATGSGKSSIVNRLAGSELSTASVRRPTTAVTHAVVWGDADADSLLDWLEISRRHRLDDAASELDGLVLLDLPDHDSTAVEHRMEVDRLVALVDVLIWVTDPQKYADEALHAGYVVPLAGHAEILRFVLNQVDRLDDRGDEIARDLERLLHDDGIADVRVVRVSALTGFGFDGPDGLEALLADAVGRRQAAIARLSADLTETAHSLRRGDAVSEGRATDNLLRGKARDRLVAGLAEAAGANDVATVATAHHRRQGSLAMGWPFTRWARRLGRRPLADLPGPGRAGAAEPRADLAVRDYAEDVASGMLAPWPAEVRRASMSERDELLDDLRRSVGRAAIGAAKRPLWWHLFAFLQRAAAVAALVGLGWLIVVAVLGGFFRFDTDPLLPATPAADWMPLPSSLLIGGVLVGLVLSWLKNIPLGVAAARRGRAARKQVERQVDGLAESRVVEPVAALLAEHRRIDELLAVASG